MKTKDAFTKTMAVAGTLLVWLPLLMPILLAVVSFFKRNLFRFDYLIPAELFPVGFLGGVLLIWAARRAQFKQGLIGWGLGIAIGSLVFGQELSKLTGLASGAMEPEGFWFGILIASLVIFSLAMVAAGIGGLLLLKHLFKPTPLAE